MTKRNLCQSCAEPLIPEIPAAVWASPSLASPPLVDPTVTDRPADRPSEVWISDPVTVQELAAILKTEPFRVIALLMEHNLYVSSDSLLSFDSASLVCADLGVTAHRTS